MMFQKMKIQFLDIKNNCSNFVQTDYNITIINNNYEIFLLCKQ